MARIYSTPDRPRSHQQALEVTQRFQVSQFRYYYRKLRKAGLDPWSARSTLWQTAFYASLYPTQYVNMEGNIP